MSNKQSIKKQVKWIQLSLYINCFNDKEKTHLGFKYKNIFYCLTHSRSKFLVPDKCLRMNTENKEKTFLTRATTRPKLINLTNMRISKAFFYNNIIKYNPDYYLNKNKKESQ